MTNLEITKAYVGNTEVSKIYLGNDLVWNSIDYAAMPLTFEIISGGTIFWKATSNSTSVVKTIEYQLNDGNWTSITSTTDGIAIIVTAGDELKFRGDNPSYANWSSRRSSFSADTSAVFSIKGNIMSLIDSVGYAEAKTLTEGSTFNSLFFGCYGLNHAENLVLPATTLTESCYYGMFQGCTGLTAAPALPATTLADSCYYSMFQSCTSLTAAPALPATTLADNCYILMFASCTGLTTAPELPATTLSTGCYGGMFADCTNLNYIKCLATDISADYCTDTWVLGTSPTGTFVKAANMDYWFPGTSGIPDGWTVIDAQL